MIFLAKLKKSLPFLLFFLVLSHFALAETISKQTVLDKYQKVIALAEELNVYQEDVLGVVPKIKFVAEALVQNHFDQADRVLNEAAADLDWVRSHRPKRFQKALQAEWLEIYKDIIEKFAFLVLLAYFFIRWAYHRKVLRDGRLTVRGKIYLVGVFTLAAVIFSILDLSRYGESAWFFLDTETVLVAIGGLLGGFWPGLFLGLTVGAFRLFISSQFIVYAAIALAAGILAGLISRFKKNDKRMPYTALLTGAAMGLIHGAAIYLPMSANLPWIYIFGSIAFIALLEALALFIFFAMVIGLLKEEARKEMERELLRTRFLFLQSQINPHFLYNALNTISAVCHEESAFRGQHLILRLADFMRGTLKRIEDKVTLREEMQHLDAYLEIEKARFQDRLCIQKNIDLSEALWSVRLPFLILQPLVENAVKHGIGKKEQGGTIELKTVVSNGHLKILIRDDGIGMTEETLKDLLTSKGSQETGIGVQNVNQRLIQSFGPQYGLQFESEGGKGTTVIVTIPVKPS